MKRMINGLLVGMLGLLLVTTLAAAHCEIPCGIYDDLMRIEMIREDITTIEKSMIQIAALEKETTGTANQLVRWIANKDKHANNIQEIVSQYFLTQRIKPGDKDYEAKLSSLHEILIASMQCKQTTDMAHVKKLRELLDRFEKLYIHTHEAG
jgi:nickel superoxide dismutase